MPRGLKWANHFLEWGETPSNGATLNLDGASLVYDSIQSFVEDCNLRHDDEHYEQGVWLAYTTPFRGFWGRLLGSIPAYHLAVLINGYVYETWELSWRFVAFPKREIPENKFKLVQTLLGIVVLFCWGGKRANMGNLQEISVPGMRTGLSGSGSASRRTASDRKKKWHLEVHAEETLDDSP